MLKEAIHHENFGIYAYPKTQNELNLRLRVAKNDILECYVYYTERYNYTSNLLCKKMQHFLHDEYYDYFNCTIELESKRFKYFFKLIDINGQHLYYLEDGFTRDFPENTLNGGYFQYSYINYDDILDIPSWCKNAIFYQIFPERFYNGDKSNDPAEVQRWGTKPYSNSFFGGDIKGIISKLDYLKDLGVNAIYLTPIFLSNSNHKYDIIDYYKIDPHFGTLDDMKELVSQAHNRGIKIVLDAVFNHCSNENKIFMDVVKNGQRSVYADWFYIREFPVQTKPEPNYETFGVNIPNMPRLNTSNPKVREYLIRVAEYWTRELDIDGWRLDVADEVSHGFWKEFRTRLKSIKKDVFVIGEVWYYATPWLMGDEFDSVMNYPFRQAVIEFFAKRSLDKDGFIIRLNKYFVRYKDETPYYLLNLLGSHDTARFLTVCNGDVEKMKLAVIFTMTFVGIPMIYYGDEIGMTGGGDPDCRRTMIWDEEVPGPGLFDLYRRLIQIRKNNPVLVDGKIRFIELSSNKQVLAFARDNGSERAMVIINNSDSDVNIEIDKSHFEKGQVTDLLGGKKYTFTVIGNREIANITINRMDAVLLM